MFLHGSYCLGVLLINLPYVFLVAHAIHGCVPILIINLNLILDSVCFWVTIFIIKATNVLTNPQGEFFLSRHVIFDEQTFPFFSHASSTTLSSFTVSHTFPFSARFNPDSSILGHSPIHQTPILGPAHSSPSHVFIPPTRLAPSLLAPCSISPSAPPTSAISPPVSLVPLTTTSSLSPHISLQLLFQFQTLSLTLF